MPYYSNLQYLRIARPLPAYVKRDIYEIPFIENDDIDISKIKNGKWLISPNNMTPRDKFAHRKTVHAFRYDDELVRYFNNPIRYIQRAASYEAVASFDFSMSPEMGFHEIYSATYNNRWTGAFAQSLGKKAFATVGWVGPQYYDITFAGLRDESVFLISTLGVNNGLSSPMFIQGYCELRSRFPDSKLVCVGDRIKGMDSDVCFVDYEDSFGYEDIKSGYWQPQLVNWDMSLPKEVI